VRPIPKHFATAAAVIAAAAGGGTFAFAAAGDDVPLAAVSARPAHTGPPAMSRGYEVWRSDIVQPDVEITTSGHVRQGTHVLTLHLNAGSYFVWAFMTAGKATGNGYLRCAILVPEGAVTFARASMGDQPGTSSGDTLSSNGTYTVQEGGMDLELKCTQEPGATGANPRVFDAVIDALEVGSIVSNNGS
jgi:hypothetical protein